MVLVLELSYQDLQEIVLAEMALLELVAVFVVLAVFVEEATVDICFLLYANVSRNERK